MIDVWPEEPSAPDESSEAPAIASIARSEEISKLFCEHNKALVNFIRTRVGNEQEAREVAQEAYVKLLQLDAPLTVSYLRWYLFRIAKFIATDRFRQNSGRARLDHMAHAGDLDLSNPTEDGVIAADELSRLRAALRELPPKCQEAFLLHRLRGLSTVEVGARMGISDRMVRLHIQRALAYCRLRCDGLTAAQASRGLEA